MAEVANLGELIVKFSADIGDLAKQLKEAQVKVDEFGGKAKVSVGNIAKIFAGLGATVVTALGAAVVTTVKFGDEIFDLSRQTGIATETLSKLKFVAEQAESSFAAVAQGFKILSKNIFEAESGNIKMKASFDALNISLRNAQGHLLSADQVFLNLADKFKNIQDDTAKAGLAIQLFGRNGVALIPILNLGSEEIKRLSEEAEKLGVVLTKDNAILIDEFSDELKKLKASIGGISLIVGTTLIPILTKFAEFLKTSIIPLIENMNAAFLKTASILKENQFKEALGSPNALVEDANRQLIAIQERLEQLRSSKDNLSSSGGRGAGGESAIEEQINNLLIQRTRLQRLIIDQQDETVQKIQEQKEVEDQLAVQQQINAEQNISKQIDIQSQITQIIQQKDAVVTFAQQMIQLSANIESSFSNALSGLISGSLTVKEAFNQLGQSLVKSIADFIAQQIISATIGKALRQIELIAIRFFAAAVGEAWAVPAALAAVATAGGAAVAGGSALASVVALSKGFALPFAEGTDSVPSRLSPGEIVIPNTFASAIRQGRLSLSGGRGGNSESNQTVGDININIVGNVDDLNFDDMVGQIRAEIGEQFERRLRGAV